MRSFTLDGKSVLVTGGTGSFGKKFVEVVLKKYPRIRRLIVFSRDELKQYEMSLRFSEEKYPAMRYFIGDVRDPSRLHRAFEDVDYVIHAAALKQVPAAEYNPIEFIQTNIIGAENVINAALNRGVKKVIALSTDKAAAPINLYGATKLCADKLFIAANNIRGKREIIFSVVRYGNVMNSRGSVIPFFLEQKVKRGVLPLTDLEMTRFNITLEEGVNFVLFALENAWGGELFVPKLPSYRLTDLAIAISPGSKVKIIGIRQGEKIHEEMITESDSLNTVEFKDYYVILPTRPLWDMEKYIKKFQGARVKRGFRYSSGTNPNFLTVAQLKKLIDRIIHQNLDVKKTAKENIERMWKND